jgi:hypothetical protein
MVFVTGVLLSTIGWTAASAMNSLRKLFLFPFAVAAIGPIGLWLLRSEVFAGMALAAIPGWIALFLLGIRRHGKQALWLLLVVPFLCYVPFLFWEWSRACAQNLKACP